VAETDTPRSWDRRARAREEFIDAAYRVIDTHGPRPSMNDIAKEAGATKPRLYRHFADKADLYKAIADRTTHDVYKLVAPKFNFLLTTPHEALNHAITGYAEVVAEHPNVFRFLADGELKQDGAGSALSLDVERDLTDRLADEVPGVRFSGVFRRLEPQVGGRDHDPDRGAGGEPDVGDFGGHGLEDRRRDPGQPWARTRSHRTSLPRTCPHQRPVSTCQPRAVNKYSRRKRLDSGQRAATGATSAA